ncbi:MAG: transketolase [Deltaproteobacteria bacterium]|nr:transketolase [Deltaproteobacteria bacterium]
MEIVSRPHHTSFIRWAATRPRVLVLTADLTASCEADGFRDAFPERCFSMGMAEQNMVGFAAGLAREGFSPWLHTFAVFLTRRVFDQVAMAVAYPNLRVRLCGFLPGITTPGGVTHQAVDDLALMRVLPNMTALECGDATEVESFPDVAEAVDGPVYVRVLRGEVPRLFPRDRPLELGRARELSRGEDVTVISSGICTEEALRVVAALRGRAGSPGLRLLHVSTLKPFTDQAVLAAVLQPRCGVITLENHSVVGGLGSAVAEVMAEHGAGRPLVRLGLQDVYAHGASRRWLMREHGLDAAALLRAVERLIDQPLGLSVEELDAQDPVPGLDGAAAPAPAPAERVEDL